MTPHPSVLCKWRQRLVDLWNSPVSVPWWIALPMIVALMMVVGIGGGILLGWLFVKVLL